MGVKHNYTAVTGELISPDRWNADHNITGSPTLEAITLVAQPSGFNITCTTAGKWYPGIDGDASDDGSPLRFYIRGSKWLTMDRSDVSVRWKAVVSAGGPTCNIRIVRVSDKLGGIGDAYQWFSVSGQINTTLQTDITAAWPTGTTEYIVQVKADLNDVTVTLYNVMLYAYKL